MRELHNPIRAQIPCMINFIPLPPLRVSLIVASLHFYSKKFALFFHEIFRTLSMERSFDWLKLQLAPEGASIIIEIIVSKIHTGLSMSGSL